MNELEKFLKTIPREHWGGFYAYYDRYCKNRPFKTSWYFYKKEYYRQLQRQQKRQKQLIQKIGDLL